MKNKGANNLSVHGGNRKTSGEKTTAKLKDKQTSIKTVREQWPTSATFPNPFIFHFLQTFKTKRVL